MGAWHNNQALLALAAASLAGMLALLKGQQ